MNSIKTYIFVFVGLLVLVLGYVFAGTRNSIISPEISIFSTSSLGKSFGKVIAASCAFTPHGAADEYTTCTSNPVCPGTPSITLSVPGRSQCGGVCNPAYPTICNSLCSVGIIPVPSYLNHDIIYQGVYAYKNDGSGKPTPSYTLGTCPEAIRPQVRRLCEINRTTSDGSQTSTWTENYDTAHTIWTNQPTKRYPYTENIKVRCGYFSDTLNNYIYLSPWVQANAVIESPNYGQPCSGVDTCGVSFTNGTYDIYGVCSAANNSPATCKLKNVCGQEFTGYQCPSGCTAGGGSANVNNACIANFKVTSSTVNPNGSVEFSWSIPEIENVTSKCGFVDLTTPTPRPIPGLQNLDPTINSARISNIQATTRFCLICQFYSLLTSTGGGANSPLGNAAVHQWVRVIRIGEN